MASKQSQKNAERSSGCWMSSISTGSDGSVGKWIISGMGAPSTVAVRAGRVAEIRRRQLQLPAARFGQPWQGFQAWAGRVATWATTVAIVRAVTASARVPRRARLGERQPVIGQGALAPQPGHVGQHGQRTGGLARAHGHGGVERCFRLLRGLPAQRVRERARVEVHALHPAGRGRGHQGHVEVLGVRVIQGRQHDGGGVAFRAITQKPRDAAP